MNKTTRAISTEEYKLIVETCKIGFKLNNRQVRANPRIATIIVLQFCLGLRIGDLVALKLNDVIKDGNRYRLDIVEEKTGKKREFTIPAEVYSYMQNWCLHNSISPHSRMFEITVRSVQRHIQLIVEFLGLEGNISTHSIRKAYASEIYFRTKDIMLLRHLLQHASPTTSLRYICVSPALVEKTIEEHVNLLD